jgi:hypothetical protein
MLCDSCPAGKPSVSVRRILQLPISQGPIVGGSLPGNVRFLPFEGSGVSVVPGSSVMGGGQGLVLRPLSVTTPYTTAVQASTPSAMQSWFAAANGAPLYRQGTTGMQAVADAQFWSFSNPASTPGYANLMGMPGTNGTGGYSWMMGGSLRPGSSFITRPSPGMGSNVGGATEAVVSPGSVQIEWFHMP